MNMIPVLARAFGVDPTRFEAIVDAYESPGIIMPPADRLALIEARWEERGRPDGDFAWLLGEVKRLRGELAAVGATLAEALNSGRGVYQP